MAAEQQRPRVISSRCAATSWRGYIVRRITSCGRGAQRAATLHVLGDDLRARQDWNLNPAIWETIAATGSYAEKSPARVPALLEIEEE